jgi:hypothetical protein
MMDKKVFLQNINQILKSYGFKKKTSKWERCTGDLFQIIELQKSRYGDFYYINLYFDIIEKKERIKSFYTGIRLDKIIDVDEKYSKMLNLENDFTDDVRLFYLDSLLKQTIMKLDSEFNSVNDLVLKFKKGFTLPLYPELKQKLDSR